ncbi:4-hydroxy-tetrahydrodipicolinate synthase [Salipaludibacillus neizhouensis]|uniref:4-hydroxy-tetrahydrodipicolinate synthase n=1 Tax=Salipaludibacillus neizhouensis TaxID=885475 RepID=A0A3A9KJZ8_9BACI|nr:4-hydroxy-tetrahydrodipicolinate synthase [Salipaludibacillus neizhouensis]RKL68105.1 4-hydroxy-tetrahydrodipicolinate synthase [Salipaludibacillus neizhouensis]
MFKPEGIIPALVTPFDEYGDINENAFRKLIRRTIDQGCHGVFCLGSNGEFVSLDDNEKVKLAQIAIDESAGEVPVYAGTGTNSTKRTIELNKRMSEIGITAVSVITPYYVGLSQQELISYYDEIANATELPIILYNIPKITGNSLDPASVKKISQHKNVVAIKDSSGNFDYTLQLIEGKDSDYSVLIGTDSLILPSLMAGADGAIAATANFVPKTVSSIYNDWQKGDYESAQKNQNWLKKVRGAFKLGTMPSVLKEAVTASGIEVGLPRKPVQPLSNEASKELHKVIDQYRKAGLI